VWVTWPDPITFDDVVSYLLGPMIGVVLRLRDTLCLHASAVSVDGGVIAFMGRSGAGKSTTAAAFAERGHGIVSDDLVPLSDGADGWLAVPAYPRLRLWPSSVDLIASISPRFPRLPADWDGRRYYVDFARHGYRFEFEPRPLRAIYLLDERSANPGGPSVEAASAQDAMMTLVANTFGARVLDQTMRAHEFAQLGQLLDSVPVRRVRPQADPAALPRMCEVILEDLERLAPALRS
jgi:hypothetical protein